MVQDKFNRIVLNGSDSNGGLVEGFGKGFGEITMKVNLVRFVVERTPYIHIPCDKHHVLESLLDWDSFEHVVLVKR